MRPFQPEDLFRLRTAADPRVSPDGARVAWVQGDVDTDGDRVSTSIWVAASDGSDEPRAFAPGPSDSSPRWSPDGRWLAYISVPQGEPRSAHVRLASLDGGVPGELGSLPGPVSQPAWSPDSTRLAVVVTVGLKPAERSAAEGNAPRRVRGLADRLDGVGVHDGRRHVFVIDIATGNATQITQGDYDHASPAWSPDGKWIVVASDRDRRRDDRQFRSDAWVVPSVGGRARRLTTGGPRVSTPTFSPDGLRVAFVGVSDGTSWNGDSYVYVVETHGGEPPRRLAPSLDRGVLAVPGGPPVYQWVNDSSIAALIASEGTVGLHTVSLARSNTREIVGGDRQIDAISIAPAGKLAAFTSTWPDRPSEVWVTALTGPKAGQPRQLSHMNDGVCDEVELGSVQRTLIVRPDGRSIEYFLILPPGGGKGLPVHLDIHGGPHGMWPSGRFLAFHQALASAGYAVLLPNPRGSTSYGQDFTAACTNDWGGADYEDIMACCDDVVRRGIGDADQMFVSGGSYGGFMTAWIVGHTPRFKAATPMAAVIDQVSMLGTTEIPDFSAFNFAGTPWESSEVYRQRSPLTYLPDVQTPVLVVHWEGDLRVPISQGEELYTGLRMLGKQAEFVRYPGGFHALRSPSQNVDWVRQILSWNAVHAGSKAPSKPVRRRPVKG